MELRSSQCIPLPLTGRESGHHGDQLANRLHCAIKMTCPIITHIKQPSKPLLNASVARPSQLLQTFLRGNNKILVLWDAY